MNKKIISILAGLSLIFPALFPIWLAISTQNPSALITYVIVVPTIALGIWSIILDNRKGGDKK